MCGILGYLGKKKAIPILIDGLRRLEYRGYDSAGVAVLEPDASTQDTSEVKLEVVRAKGKLFALEDRLKSIHLHSTVGMGHTRWATHGKPSDENAHPHKYDSVAVVHNGIIENYLELRHQLLEKGHQFQSDTDTEVIAHLISAELKNQTHPDLLLATRNALQKVHGAYAIVVLSDQTPNEIVCAKNASPLIIGLGQNENFVASDLPALLPHTRRVMFLEEGDIAKITNNSVFVCDLDGKERKLPVKEITWSAMTAEKEGYKHFMLKEIHEQVRALTDTLRGRIEHEPANVWLDGYELHPNELRRIYLVACGTSFHAARVGEYWLEQMTKIPVKAELASEFRYREPIVGKGDLVIALSQSGETIDTLGALREAKIRGATVFSIVNVVGSSIPRASDFTFYTHAGLEIGVASTKAFTTQLAALFMLSVYLGRRTNTLSEGEASKLIEELTSIPHKMNDTLSMVSEPIQKLARQQSHAKDVLFLGRGLQFPIALEGALKLKEISYIHAEGYAGGEIKHGPMALIDDGLPVVILGVQDQHYEKILSNLSEVKARGAYVIAIATAGDLQMVALADEVLSVPQTLPALYPFLTVIPLQLLAYYVADQKGTDVDQPRNLAKSVTVE